MNNAPFEKDPRPYSGFLSYLRWLFFQDTRGFDDAFIGEQMIVVVA
jgi:hypothetical protein